MNLKKTSVVALLTLSAALIGQAALPADSVEFKFTHRLGKVDRFRAATQMVGSMKMADPMPEQKFSQTMEQEFQTVCRKIYDNGTGLYEMAMPLMAMKMDAGGFKSTFQSEAGKPVQMTVGGPGAKAHQPGTMTKILSAMTNGKYTTLVGPDGTPLKVMGFAETMKKALADSDNMSMEDKAFVRMFREMFKDDKMLDMTKGRTDIFPHRGPVRIGDTWEREQEMKMPMFNLLIKTRTQYRLTGIEEFRGRPCAKVDVRQTMQATSQKNAANAGAPSIFDSMELNMKASEGQGTAYLDFQNSQVVQLRQVQRITMDITVKNLPGDNTSDPQKRPLHMKQSLVQSVRMDLMDPEPSPTPKP